MFRLPKKIRNYKRGQALVEITLILPMLLTLTLGAVELGNLIYTYQILHHLVAQGASMASRVTPPTTVTDLVNKVIDASCPTISQGAPPPATCPPDNSTKWRVIYTQIETDPSATGPNPPYVVVCQIVRGGAQVISSKRVCTSCGLADVNPTCDAATPTNISPDNIPNIADIGSGQTLFVFEVFYDYSPITFLGNFVGNTFAGTLYERSIF